MSDPDPGASRRPSGELCFETVFEAVDIPTAILDADGDIVVWNDALGKLLGIPRSEVEGLDSIGERIYDGERSKILAEKVLEHPQNADEVYDLDRASSDYALLDLDDQPTYEDTSTVVGGSGADIWFLAVPVYDDGEFRGVVEFVQRQSDSERQRRERERLIDELNETLAAFEADDYTVRAEYDYAEDLVDEEELAMLENVNRLARMRDALRKQARENARLDEFASIVSHDLRNPLNVAQGRLELAQLEHDTDHLDGVEDALDRMETLIEDLLAYAREGETVTDAEPVDLAGTVEWGMEGVDAEDATLDVRTTAVVRADESRLRQLLENLLRNAVEHGRGAVTVTVGDLPDGFYVADDGPGIPETEREKVFESGYSTADEGTGLGLAIVQEIATAHGWDIDVTESRAGGARVEVTSVEFVEHAA